MLQKALRNSPLPLALLVLLALGLRLVGAWSAHLTFDERAHWALAETIDLRPGHLHLVSRSLDHPLLSIYVLRAGSLVFGSGDFALRVLYVLAGAATLVPVYLLARRAFSHEAGLWAAALLAVDPFHAGWSRVFLPEVLMLLAASLAMLQFLRVLERPTTGRCLALGALVGVAYLAKEPAALLLPAMWVYLLVSPEHRRLMVAPRWWLMHAAAAAVVAPDLIWNAAVWPESYLHRDALLAGDGLRLSVKPLSLYLGEWFRWLIGPDVLGEDYLEGNLYVCHPLAGLVYLLAVAAVAKIMGDCPDFRLGENGTVPFNGTRRAALRWMLVVFAVFFTIFLVMPGGEFYEPFWWASISLIPAVVCAGGMVERWTGHCELSRTVGRVFQPVLEYCGRVGKPVLREDRPSGSIGRAIVAGTMLVLFCVSTAMLLSRPGCYEPRATARQFANDFTERGKAALERGDLREAEARFVYALNIGGPSAEAYFGLFQVACQRGQSLAAQRMLERCRAVDPKYLEGIEWFRTERSKRM